MAKELVVSDASNVIGLAIAANAKSITTGNTRDRATGEFAFHGIRIGSPSNWVKEED